MKHPVSSGEDGCEMGIPRAISPRLYVVGPRTGEGLPVCALRCRMDGAGCTAASVQVPRRSQESTAFGRQLRSTGVIQRGQQQNGAYFASSYAKAKTSWLEFNQLGVTSRREYRKWPGSGLPSFGAGVLQSNKYAFIANSTRFDRNSCCNISAVVG